MENLDDMKAKLKKLQRHLEMSKDPEYKSYMDKAERIKNREEILNKINELTALLAKANDFDEAYKLLDLKRKYFSDSECISDLI